jgi:hypothetical protein
MRGVGYIGV